jgi:Cu(I)/Ag(I) efflux system membrane protein CusA/SilA
MQRIAVPMIGGMVSSTVLTLVVIPAVYALIKGWRLPRSMASEETAIEQGLAGLKAAAE